MRWKIKEVRFYFDYLVSVSKKDLSIKPEEAGTLV